MEQEKSNNLLAIVSVVIIVALVIGVGFYFWQKSTTQSLQIVNRTPEGTTSGQVDSSKMVKGSLGELSVTFNNSIDATTLTADTFYALHGINDKVPASILYNDQSKTATLKFNAPEVATSNVTRVTVILENIKDKNGSLLDKFLYNIDIDKKVVAETTNQATQKSLKEYFATRKQFVNSGMVKNPNELGLKELGNVVVTCPDSLGTPCGGNLLILSKNPLNSGNQEFYLAFTMGTGYTYYGLFTDDLQKLVNESKAIKSLERSY